MVHVSQCKSSENMLQSSFQGFNIDESSNACHEKCASEDNKDYPITRPKSEDNGLMSIKASELESGNINMDITMKSAVHCKCSCHYTSKCCQYNSTLVENAKFRDLLLLHLDLIEQQNVHIQQKEKLILQMRTENDQLNARLNRMERRVALKIRKNTEDIDDDVSKNKNERCDSRKKFRRSSSQVSSVTVSSEHSKENGTGSYLKTDVSYLHSENYASFETSANSDIEKGTKIQVPVWKNVAITTLNKEDSKKLNVENQEDEQTDDESYLRRHSKMEVDEIRRKRWDVQQLRQERIQESLKQRQKYREDMKNGRLKINFKDPTMTSLHPPSDNVMALEISDAIPVFALGSRVPQMQQLEFQLPWFDEAKRTIQNRERNIKKHKRRSLLKY